MIRAFLCSWVLYWLLVLLLPVHSIYPAVGAAFLLQLTFVLLVTAGYFLGSPDYREILLPDVIRGEIAPTRALVRISLWMSLAGFLMLLFDKIFIQHIDYTSGLAIARQRWADLGEAREGRPSSIWSILGYALGSAYYVTAVLALTQTTLLSAQKRLRALVGAFLFALANSIITGGRSNFLLLAVVSLSALSARRGLRFDDIFTSRGQRRFVAVTAGLSAIYVVFIFVGRASAGDQVAYEYVVNYLPWIGVAFDEWYVKSVGEGWIGTMGHMTVLVVGYLTHSFATAAAIVDAPREDKVILFANVADILYKFGFIPRPDGVWFLAGRFPSVPGALWHQFGAGGFAIGSLLLGLVGSWTSLWARMSPRRLLPLGIYVLTAATLLLTPYTFAPDFLSFPSVVVAVVALAVLSRLGAKPVRSSRADGSSGALPEQRRERHNGQRASIDRHLDG